jgi:hypothetical protein
VDQSNAGQVRDELLAVIDHPVLVLLVPDAPEGPAAAVEVSRFPAGDIGVETALHPAAVGPGVSYLDVCAAATGDLVTAQVEAAIRRALRGDLPGSFTIEVPCHSPGTAIFSRSSASWPASSGMCAQPASSLGRNPPEPAVFTWPPTSRPRDTDDHCAESRRYARYSRSAVSWVRLIAIS